MILKLFSCALGFACAAGLSQAQTLAGKPLVPGTGFTQQEQLACTDRHGQTLHFGPCTAAELAAGAGTGYQPVGPIQPVSTVPAGAVAPGSTAGFQTAGGVYSDPSFPQGVIGFQGTVPLSAFASTDSITQLQSSVTSETARAQAAETRLSQAIAAETAARQADIARVTIGYERATAMAAALSGMTVIPGKRLNLSVNVGGYEGQTALSGAAAFAVTRSVYVSGGVATGTSGGGAAYRAGVTLGF